MIDLAALSARGMAKAIRDKQVSSVEATRAAIERLQACHELTHCIIALEVDEALAAIGNAYPDWTIGQIDHALAVFTRQLDEGVPR